MDASPGRRKMGRAGEFEAHGLLDHEMSEAITSYVRGLIAADYSVRTVDASAGDLGQFAAFLSARGIHVPGQITRADISAFAEALAEGTLVSPDQERKNGPSPRYLSAGRQAKGS